MTLPIAAPSPVAMLPAQGKTAPLYKEWGNGPAEKTLVLSLMMFRTYRVLEAERAPYSVIEPYALAIGALLKLDRPAAPVHTAEEVRAHIAETAQRMAGKHEAETEAGIKAALKAKGAERIDDLIADIEHAIANWSRRVNQYGVVELIDGLWLRRGISEYPPGMWRDD